VIWEWMAAAAAEAARTTAVLVAKISSQEAVAAQDSVGVS
jgi:hypothetical protein